MGFGLPAAMGAKLARPEAQVVAICGDGGFHRQATNWTPARGIKSGSRRLCLLMEAFGLIRHYQYKGTGRHADVSTRFSPGGPDFVKLAEANHCVGMHAESVKDFEEKIFTGAANRCSVVLAVPSSIPHFNWSEAQRGRTRR